MAQKAAKQTARRNTQILNRTHVIALGIVIFYLLLRVVFFRSTFTRSSFLLFGLLSSPAFAIEGLFEINSRPKYVSSAPTAELRRSGQDLEAKGLTEWMWDVLYWTWGCTILAAVVGDWAWWLCLAVPMYSAWLAYSTFGSLRSGMGMGQPATQHDDGSSQTGSKRQAKMEKRGGQRSGYR